MILEEPEKRGNLEGSIVGGSGESMVSVGCRFNYQCFRGESGISQQAREENVALQEELQLP